MPKDTFQFRVTNPAGDYYYVVGQNVLTTSAIKNLYASVVDWDKLQLNWKRHPIYKGIFKKYSPELIRFSGDVALILKKLFNTQSVEARANLEVWKLKTTDQQYYLLGSFAFDFGLYVGYELFVDIGLVEAGIANKVTAFDTVPFPIELGEPGVDIYAEYLWLDAILLKGKYNFAFIPAGSGSVDTAGSGNNRTVPIVYVDQEGSFSVGTPNADMLPSVQFPGGGSFDHAFMFQVFKAYKGNISVNTPISMYNSQPFTTAKLYCEVNIYDASHTLVYNYDNIYRSPAIAYSDTLNDTINGSLPVDYNFSIGDFIVVNFRAVGISGGGDYAIAYLLPSPSSMVFAGDPGTVELTFDYLQDGSPCRAYNHYNVFENLFHKLTGSTAVNPRADVFLPVYPGPLVYNLDPSNTFFTCGDALRQLYVDAEGNPKNPEMLITLQDFAKDAFVTLCAGIGLEKDSGGNDILRMEHLSYFYQRGNVIADLGSNIKDWKTYPYKDYMANKITAGYADQTYDEVNGRNEINAGTTWQTSMETIKDDIDYVSPYRADAYGPEYVRANLANKQTTDSSSDNDVFKLQSNGDRLSLGYTPTPDPYKLDRAQTVTAGLPADVAPTLYNFPLSPKRNMLRLIPWLKANYGNVLDQRITFKTGTKNTAVVSSMYTGPTVTENEDIDLKTFTEQPLHIPRVMEFTTAVPRDLDYLMTTNPYGVFSFKYRGYYIEGFPLDVGVNPGTDDAYTFKLLLSPDTPLPDTL